MSMSPVVHFEMAAEDTARMVDFYAKTFGWQADQLGPDMGDYVIVRTSQTGEDGFPAKPGMINGGLYPKEKDKPDQHPSLVIAVEDIQEHMKKVTAAGGEILGEPMDVPGYGIVVSFRDTEGNRVSMIQPVGM